MKKLRKYPDGGKIKVGQYKNVSTQSIDAIAKEAIAKGVNPYEALAIAYQETGIGSAGNNPNILYHTNPNYYNANTANAVQGVQSIQNQINYANSLIKRGVIPNTDAHRLQGYNGYGVIKKGHADLGNATSIYGVPIPEEGINFKKTPLYGQRVINVQNNVIKKNPDVMGIVSQYQGPVKNKPKDWRTSAFENGGTMEYKNPAMRRRAIFAQHTANKNKAVAGMVMGNPANIGNAALGVNASAANVGQGAIPMGQPALTQTTQPNQTNQGGQQGMEQMMSALGPMGLHSMLLQNDDVTKSLGIGPNVVRDQDGNVIGQSQHALAAVGSGAASGMAKGTQLGMNPALMAATGGLSAPIGAALGGIYGGITGYTENKEKERELNNMRLGANNNIYRRRSLGNVGSTIPMTQTNRNDYFGENGLYMNKNANAEIEDGEYVEIPNDSEPVAFSGGALRNGSSDGYIVDGNTHEQGGVDVHLPEGAKVFSNNLKYNGRTFASIGKKIDKSISSMEDKLENNPRDSRLTNAIERMKQKREMYFNKQQEMNDNHTGDYFDVGGVKGNPPGKTWSPAEYKKLVDMVSKAEGRDLTSIAAHGNGAYGPYGFLPNGHLKTYWNSRSMPAEIYNRYPSYTDLWKAYSSGTFDKDLIPKLHSGYPDWLLRTNNGDAERAAVYNFVGNTKAYDQAKASGTLNQYYGTTPRTEPGKRNMTIGQYIGNSKYTGVLPELVISGQRVNNQTQATGVPANATQPAAAVTPQNREIMNYRSASGGVNSPTPPPTFNPLTAQLQANQYNFSENNATPPPPTSEVDPLYQAQPWGMAAGAAANLYSNAVQQRRINQMGAPRNIASPMLYAGPAPSPIDYSAEINNIDAGLAADRTLLRRGVSGNSLGANMANLRAVSNRQKNQVYGQARNANAGLANEYNRYASGVLNQQQQLGYANDVMNNENLYNYNLWKTGAKNAATAGLARTFTDLGNSYTQNENQNAQLDAILRSNKSGTGGRAGFAPTTKNKRRIR